jgi:hypothetical protein
MKAKLGFLTKAGTVKVFKATAAGVELLIDLEGGGSATIVLDRGEVSGIIDAAKNESPVDDGPKVA